MKVCSVCGCHNTDATEVCCICGVRFPASSIPETAPAPVPTPVVAPASAPAAPAPQKAPVTKQDRMALAGFVLSLMGLFSCVTTPLQAAALILSLCSAKARRFRGFRIAGIVISALTIAASLFLWVILILTADLWVEAFNSSLIY